MPQVKPTSFLWCVLWLTPCLVGAQNSRSDGGDPEARIGVGQQMPAFTIPDTSGRVIDIQTLRGSVVVVNFWATWCPPCRAELPRLENEIWRKYRTGNFVVIGISRGEQQSKVASFAADFGLTYRIAADPDRHIYGLFAKLGIPRTYVVDRTGKIVFASVGYEPDEFDQLKQVIARELSKSPKR